jgi:hypothetical protein
LTLHSIVAIVCLRIGCRSRSAIVVERGAGAAGETPARFSALLIPVELGVNTLRWIVAPVGSTTVAGAFKSHLPAAYNYEHTHKSHVITV